VIARARFAAALVLTLLGGAGALLVSGRAWQTIVAPRPRPFADEVVDVSGRTLEPLVAALGLVALAGVVAVLATRGIARRAVGVLLAVAAVAMGWRALAGSATVSAAKARSLVSDARTGAGLDPGRPAQVTVHAAWPVLAVACAVALLVAGAAVAAWGHRWAGLSGRYEPPDAGIEADRQRSGATMWTALDRGDDPTARTET
jgi:uncharacterized membrane protein (TIGR02234 family)